MKQVAYSLFETPLGWCGIAWNEGPNSGAGYAVTLFQLPEATTELTESRIARNSGAAKSSKIPLQVTNICKRVCNHLNGVLQDFRDIPVDLDESRSFCPKSLRGRPQNSRGTNCYLRRPCQRLWADPAWPEPWDGRWAGIPFPSSSPAIGSWPPTANPEASPPLEAG